MSIHSALIDRLECSVGSDRRLDAEIIAYAIGPAGCVIDDTEGLDGWDIHHRPDIFGVPAYWREASDIPPLTLNLDAAVELLSEARPLDGSEILHRALRRIAAAPHADGLEELVSRIARTTLAELMKVIASEKHQAVAQAA